MPSRTPLQPRRTGAAPATRVYTAQVDADPCPACAALAGLEYPSGQSDAPTIPNPSCTHREGCRCAWL